MNVPTTLLPRKTSPLVDVMKSHSVAHIVHGAQGTPNSATASPVPVKHVLPTFREDQIYAERRLFPPLFRLSLNFRTKRQVDSRTSECNFVRWRPGLQRERMPLKQKESLAANSHLWNTYTPPTSVPGRERFCFAERLEAEMRLRRGERRGICGCGLCGYRAAVRH